MDKVGKLVSFTALIIGFSGAFLSVDSRANFVNIEQSPHVGQLGYELTATNRQFASDVYELYYQTGFNNERLPLTSTLRLEGHNTFNLQLFKGNLWGTTEDAQPFTNDDSSTTFVIEAYPSDRVAEWLGDIINRGRSNLHFVSSNRGRSSAFKWRFSFGSQVTRSSGTTNYFFSRPNGAAATDTFDVIVDGTTGTTEFELQEGESLTIETGVQVTVKQYDGLSFAGGALHPSKLNFRITAAHRETRAPQLVIDVSGLRQLTIPSLAVYYDDINSITTETVLIKGTSALSICLANTANGTECGRKFKVPYTEQQIDDSLAIIEAVTNRPSESLLVVRRQREGEDLSSAVALDSNFFSVGPLRSLESIDRSSRDGVVDNTILNDLTIELRSANNPANANAFTTEVKTRGYLQWLEVVNKEIDHSIIFALPEQGQRAEILIGCNKDDNEDCYGPYEEERSIDYNKLQPGTVYLMDKAKLELGAGVSLVSAANFRMLGNSKLMIKMSQTVDEASSWRDGSKILIKGDHPLQDNLLEQILFTFEDKSDSYQDKVISLIQYQRDAEVETSADLVASKDYEVDGDSYTLRIVGNSYNDNVLLFPPTAEISFPEINHWLMSWQEGATRRFFFTGPINENFPTDFNDSTATEFVDNLETTLATYAGVTYLRFKPVKMTFGLVETDNISLFTNVNLQRLVNILSAAGLVNDYQAIFYHLGDWTMTGEVALKDFRIDGEEERDRLLFKSDSSFETIRFSNIVGGVDLKKVKAIYVGEVETVPNSGYSFLGKLSWGRGLTATEKNDRTNYPLLYVRNSRVTVEKNTDNSNQLQYLEVDGHSELVFADLDSGLTVKPARTAVNPADFASDREQAINIYDEASIQVANTAARSVGKLLEGRFTEASSDLRSFVEQNLGEETYKIDNGYLYLTAKDDETAERRLYYVKHGFLEVIPAVGSVPQILKFHRPFLGASEELAADNKVLDNFDKTLLKKVSQVTTDTSVRGETSAFANLSEAEAADPTVIASSYTFLSTLINLRLRAFNSLSTFPIIFKLEPQLDRDAEQVSYTITGLTPELSQDFEIFLAQRTIVEFVDESKKLELTLDNISVKSVEQASSYETHRGKLKLYAKEITLSLQQFAGHLAVKTDRLAVRQQFSGVDDLYYELFTLVEDIRTDLELTLVAEGFLSWNGELKGRPGSIDYQLIFETPSSLGFSLNITAPSKKLSIDATGGITIKNGVNLVVNEELIFDKNAKLSFEVVRQEEHGRLIITGEFNPTLPGTIEIIYTGESDELPDLNVPLPLIVIHRDSYISFSSKESLPALTSSTIAGAKLVLSKDKKIIELHLNNATIKKLDEELESSSAQKEIITLKNEVIVANILNHLPSIATSTINVSGHGQVDWLFITKNSVSEKVALSQTYSLQGGTKYQQFSVKAVGFYNRLSIYGNKTNTTTEATSVGIASSDNVAGGLVKFDYLTPVKGLTAGAYLGGGVVLADDPSYLILSGAQIGYGYAFQKRVNLQVAAVANLDFLPLIAKQGATLETEFHLRGQLGASFAVDSGNLIKRVKLGLTLPVELAVSAKIKDTATVSHLLQFKGGLTATVAVDNLFKISAGYKIRANSKFISHGISFSVGYVK